MARRRKSSSWSIALQFQDIADEVLKESEEALDAGIVKVMKETAEDLRETSPKLTGDYASTWTYKKLGKLKAVVYNNGNGSLTHLLERGHAIANGKRKFPGRVPGIKHIEPARNRAQEKINDVVKTELDKRL